jgi:hypothetical protein
MMQQQQRRHSGVAQLALGAAIVVAATFATATFARSAWSEGAEGSSEAVSPPVQSTVATATRFDSPVRDQWYLDDRSPTASSLQAPDPPVRDQWYLDQ